jgi:hypothetical protein
MAGSRGDPGWRITGEKRNELAQPTHQRPEVHRFLDIGATPAERVAGDLPHCLQQETAAGVEADYQELVAQMCFSPLSERRSMR